MLKIYMPVILVCCLITSDIIPIPNCFDHFVELVGSGARSADEVKRVEESPPLICSLTCVPEIQLTCNESIHPDHTGYPTFQATEQCHMVGTFIYEDSTDIGDCNDNIIFRTWAAVDNLGNQYTCEQELQISKAHDYTIYFPGDVEIFENSEVPDLISVSEGLCDLMAVNIKNDNFASLGDELYRIFRTFRVINWCEYDGFSEPIILSRDEDCDALPGDEPIYLIRRPDGSVYLDRNADETDGIPTAGEACSPSNPAGHWRNNMTDLSINSVGYWQYTQIIKVYEAPVECTQDSILLNRSELISGKHQAVTDISTSGSVQIPYNVKVEMIAGHSVHLNDQFEIILGGELAVGIDACEDQTPMITAAPDQEFCSFNFNCTGAINFIFDLPQGCGPAATELRVWYDENADDIIDTELDPILIINNCPLYSITGDYPIGQHQFVIMASNLFGKDTLKVDFMLRDCKPPTPICLNGPSFELQPLGQPIDIDQDGDLDLAYTIIYATDLIASNAQDCSPPVTFSIGRIDDLPDNMQISIPVTCDDIGFLSLRIYGWDTSGNYDYCENFIQVVDNMGYCAN